MDAPRPERTRYPRPEFSSLADRRLLLESIEITPENYSAHLELESRVERSVPRGSIHGRTTDPGAGDAAGRGLGARPARQCAGVPARQGSGAFDNTVVLWTSEVGAGAGHTTTNIPMVILRSRGSHFRTGQYMDYRSDPASHSDVLTSICNAMGIEIDKFGQESTCNGPLRGVT